MPNDSSTNVVRCNRGWQKKFHHHECWEVVKYCKRFVIIPTGPEVVLNETPLRDSMTSDSPLDSPMSQDSPSKRSRGPLAERPRRQRRRAKRHKNRNGAKTPRSELALEAEYAREREYLRKKDMDKTDRETMAMDTSHMSPETKQFWKLERRDVMRRRLFRDDGPSNTDCNS
ncbi:zinc ion-binding protein [Prunus dulcis]|uniref:Zinc ion-binding protein n=1 Tax=Prunus dulcis TaxID=3755 RepID=A0A5H2XKN9_PRUDU|nr:zinc ion-binding protein [Prunus dulcis]